MDWQVSTLATSVDIERGFSRGGLTVSKCRHALLPKSVRAAAVLSSWTDVPGLVPEDKIAQVFKDKSSRGKGKASTSTASNTIVIDSGSETHAD